VSIVALFLILATSAEAAPRGQGGQRGASGTYKVTRFVSDQAGRAMHQDPNLVNAWGLVAGPTTPWWVADNETNVSTLYDGTGTAIPLVVRVPGAPTGTVFNGGADFVVTHKASSEPSVFLFSTERGAIRGWNPAVPPRNPSTRAFKVADRSSEDANYKGLAIASDASGDMLYAADFHNARVDVFDGNLDLVDRPGAFVDPNIPDGYAPFGIQTIGEDVFVTYAKQDADAGDEVAGAGFGFVDMYTTQGDLVRRVASRGVLNAPWGLAMAPDDFGRFSGDLLVGNFGDGRIYAYEMESSGAFEPDGTLHRRNGDPLAIDGLWALEFGNGGAAGPTNSLFFTAGPDDEAHGLFGKIEVHG
jgi:uncharacterized protein (TIGR03118 family)